MILAVLGATFCFLRAVSEWRREVHAGDGLAGGMPPPPVPQPPNHPQEAPQEEAAQQEAVVDDDDLETPQQPIADDIPYRSPLRVAEDLVFCFFTSLLPEWEPWTPQRR